MDTPTQVVEGATAAAALMLWAWSRRPRRPRQAQPARRPDYSRLSKLMQDDAYYRISKMYAEQEGDCWVGSVEEWKELTQVMAGVWNPYQNGKEQAHLFGLPVFARKDGGSIHKEWVSDNRIAA